MLKLGIHFAVKCNCSHRKLALNTSMGGIFLVDYLPAHLYLYTLITPVKVPGTALIQEGVLMLWSRNRGERPSLTEVR